MLRSLSVVLIQGKCAKSQPIFSPPTTLLSSALSTLSSSMDSNVGGQYSTLQSAALPLQQRKFRPPQKRASKLMDQIRKEEFEKLKAGRNFPEFCAGDSIMIEKLPYMSAPKPDIIKGLVIAKSNRAGDTTISISNVEYGTPVHRQLKLYSPLIQSIKVLQRAFIHKGKKRVRRSKIYYIMDRHPSQYTVK